MAVPDIATVRRGSAEDPDFETLHEAYRPRVQRYLTRLAGEAEAEDLTQEVFLRAHRGLAAYRGEAQLSTWLYRIATNAAFDRMRRPDFRREASEVSLEDLGESLAVDSWSASEATSLDEMLSRHERFHCFVGFLNGLPVLYRIVFVLAELEGLPDREIAEVLGLSLEAVKMRLHRARTRLFEQLRAHCKPEEWL